MTARRSLSLPEATRQRQKPACAAPQRTGPEPGTTLSPRPGQPPSRTRRRRRLLASYDRALHRHEQAGHVERAGHATKGHGRPAIIWRITPAGHDWLNEHDQAPALAAAAAAQAQCKTEQAQRTATERDRALDQARATFNRQTPRISRKRAAHQLRELGCTFDQIGAIFHVSKERIRQDLLWDPAHGRRYAHPRGRRSRANPAPAKDSRSPANSASTPKDTGSTCALGRDELVQPATPAGGITHSNQPQRRRSSVFAEPSAGEGCRKASYATGSRIARQPPMDRPYRPGRRPSDSIR